MSGERLTSDVGPFSIVPEWLLDTEISDRAVRLFALLGRYANRESRGAFPSRATLARRLGCSVDSVDRAVRELELVPAIEVRAQFKPGKKERATNEYTLLLANPEVAAPVPPPSRTDAATGSRTRAAENENQLNEKPPTGDANALVAFFVDESTRRGAKAPGSMKGRVGREAKRLLAERFSEDEIKAGISRMVERGMSPSVLPSLVFEAQVRAAKVTGRGERVYTRT